MPYSKKELQQFAKIRQVCKSGRYCDKAIFFTCSIGGRKSEIRIRWRWEKSAMVAEVVRKRTVEGNAIEIRLPAVQMHATITQIKQLTGVQHVTGIIDTEYIPINELPPFIAKKPTQ